MTLPGSHDTKNPNSPQRYNRSQHHLSSRAIDEDAIKIIQRLQRSGYSAYIVGGGVRDLLLGKVPKDYDIATDATPRKVKALFSNSRIIGRRFRLVHIFFRGGKFIEVATFRDTAEAPLPDSELEASESQDNLFGTEETDARRRDITINGLFLNPETMEIIDYVGGFTDLHNKTIRVIGDPDERFPEDPVRLIRVLRHAARSGFEIEPKLWKSIAKNALLIKESSSVRVYDEFKKDLLSGSALDTLWLLSSSGVGQSLIPEVVTHQETLFRHNSSFTETFRHIDDHNRGEAKLSHTLVMAAMVFFLKNPLSDSTECAARFEDFASLNQHIHETLSHLQVTKRDFFEIESLLGQWLRVSQKKDIIKRKVSMPSDIFQELHLLMTLTDSVDLQYLGHYRSTAKQKGKR